MFFKNCISTSHFIYLLLLLFSLSGCVLPQEIHPIFSENVSLEKAAICNAQLGLYYLKENNIRLAKTKLLKAMRQAPASSIVKSAMAFFLERVGEIKASELYHLQAIILDKTSGTVHNHYGEFLYRQKRYKEAEIHFLIATQDLKYLNTARAYENAGLCVIQVSDYQKAIFYLTKALDYNPCLQKARLHLFKLQHSENKGK